MGILNMRNPFKKSGGQAEETASAAETAKSGELEGISFGEEMTIISPSKDDVIYGPAARDRQIRNNIQIAEEIPLSEVNFTPEPLKAGEGSSMMKTALREDMLRQLHEKVRLKMENAANTGSRPTYSVSERYAYHKIEQRE